MSRTFLMALLASGLVFAGPGPAASDLVIKLKDGRELRVPVEADEIQSLSFDDAESDAARGETGDAPSIAASSAPAAAGLPVLAPTLPAPARSHGGAPIQVGPTRIYKVPSQAARVARDGAVIEIDAGTYAGDVASWPQSNLTIRGVGGLAHIDAAGNSAEGKAVWVIKGNNVTIENVELSGCRVPDLNGAGIRLEGADFTLRNSFVHDNEMGVLTAANPDSDMLIESSEFARNTVDYEATGSLGHNIYIGAVRSFTLRGSYVHLASIGHNVKTRAKTNYILYNRIMDEADGNSSYLIDLAEGGNDYVIGNLLHKSAAADNSAMISYAAEAGRDRLDAKFYVVNNTAVSGMEGSVFVRNHGVTLANAMNNIFTGGQSLAEGPSTLQGNVVGGDIGLVDPDGYDYRPGPGSTAIDAGVEPATDDGKSLRPESEYHHPLSLVPRAARGPLDAGAYEAAAG